MYSIIEGGVSSDNRGQVRFVNEFTMEAVKRFYLIKNADLDVLRGWRAHRIEQRWFYVVSGCFEINLVKIDDWVKPDQTLKVEQVVLSSSSQSILHVPKGYGTLFKGIEDNSEVLVFADFPLEHAELDNYTFSTDYFINYPSLV